MFQTVIVDGDNTIYKIFPSESDLCDIKTNLPCPVSGCSSIFKSSSNLTMHLEKFHRISEPNQSSLEKKKMDNIIYQYYCPIKCCQYHNDLKSNKKKIFFHQLKYLKQHFLKVHSEKRFFCGSCEKSFSIESALKRHQVECGMEYKCSCGQPYSSRHSLLLHASRKNHFVNEMYKRPKLYSGPKTLPVTILPKPVPPECAASETYVISTSPSPFESSEFSDHKNIVSLSSNTLKEKHINSILKKKTDLSSLVKRKIVLKKFQNAQKLMKVRDNSTSLSDVPAVYKNEKSIIEVLNVANCMSTKSDSCILSFEVQSNFNLTNDSMKTFENSINNADWSKSDVKSEISESAMVFSHTDINLNELNSLSKTCSHNGNEFDNFEFTNSPKLSQSTQTHQPSLPSLVATQTECDANFDDSNLCNYYDNFDFSNSPKLSQSTQTFQSYSQVSQTDIQSSFFDDSSNNLSELIGYYDNFETSNSPKLSQSTQTIGHSLCSWSDNVTQTDLDDQLFSDSPIDQFDECYRNDPSFLTDGCITKPTIKCESNLNNMHYCSNLNDAPSIIKTTDETVSTQTGLSAVFLEDRRGKSLLDELTTSETQTDSLENSFLLISPKPQSFSSTQTQTSTSFNYLIDSETQTQELLNRLIDIETQTYVSNCS